MRWQPAGLRQPELDARAADAPDTITRGMLLAGVTGVGFLNAVSEKAYLAYHRDGLALAALNTFQVSAIIWIGIIIALHDLWSVEQGVPASGRDKMVAGCALLMILIPVPALSSCAISLIGVYIWMTAKDDTRTRSVGALLFAVTIPMLWARAIFAALSDTLLAVDARLVAWVVGTEPYRKHRTVSGWFGRYVLWTRMFVFHEHIARHSLHGYFCTRIPEKMVAGNMVLGGSFLPRCFGD